MSLYASVRDIKFDKPDYSISAQNYSKMPYQIRQIARVKLDTEFSEIWPEH